jgi:hypothetical protein
MNDYYIYIYTDPTRSYGKELELINHTIYLEHTPIYVGFSSKNSKTRCKSVDRASSHLHNSIILADHENKLFYDSTGFVVKESVTKLGKTLRTYYYNSSITDKDEFYKYYKNNHILRIDGLSKEDAQEYERLVISQVGQLCFNNGPLINRGSGGGVGGSIKGFIYVTDPKTDTEKIIPPSKLDNYLEDGWVKGRSTEYHIRNKELGKKHKDSFIKRMTTDEVLKKRSESIKVIKDPRLVFLIKYMKKLGIPNTNISKSFDINESTIKSINRYYKDEDYTDDYYLDKVFNDKMLHYIVEDKKTDLIPGFINYSVCPHCNKRFKDSKASRTKMRYHFDNCKVIKSFDYATNLNPKWKYYDEPQNVYDLEVHVDTPCYTMSNGLVSHNTVSSHSDYNLCFVPNSKNRLFMHMDMASSEARLAFAVSNELPMVDAILKGLDIHLINIYLNQDLYDKRRVIFNSR